MSTLNLIQTALAILLIAVVLVQQQGSGLGDAFGGSSGSYRSRRGIEKFWFNATIILGAAFFISALVSFILK